MSAVSARRCVYCGVGPSVRGGLEPDGPGKWSCRWQEACEDRQEKASRPDYRCTVCHWAYSSRVGLSMLADRQGFICVDEPSCASRALLGAA